MYRYRYIDIDWEREGHSTIIFSVDDKKSKPSSFIQTFPFHLSLTVLHKSSPNQLCLFSKCAKNILAFRNQNQKGWFFFGYWTLSFELGSKPEASANLFVFKWKDTLLVQRKGGLGNSIMAKDGVKKVSQWMLLKNTCFKRRLRKEIKYIFSHTEANIRKEKKALVLKMKEKGGGGKK